MAVPTVSDRPLVNSSATFDLESDVVDETFAVFTAECGVTESTPPEVTLYLTDANDYFGLAESIVGFNARPTVGLFPPTLVVAVGYADPATAFRSRARDLTPTWDAARSDRLPEMGGADAFADALETEIIPWVEARYGSDTTRAYAGCSLGGLFGAHLALTRTDVFDDYVLGSPAVFWDDECLLQTELTTGARPRVFVGVGGEESVAGGRRVDGRVARRAAARDKFGLSPIDNLTGAVRLADHLDRNEMRVRLQVFEGEHHTTVFPLVLTTGLRWLFADLAEG